MLGPSWSRTSRDVCANKKLGRLNNKKFTLYFLEVDELLMGRFELWKEFSSSYYAFSVLMPPPSTNPCWVQKPSRLVGRSTCYKTSKEFVDVVVFFKIKVLPVFVWFRMGEKQEEIPRKPVHFMKSVNETQPF
jgi:hypothetical protein